MFVALCFVETADQLLEKAFTASTQKVGEATPHITRTLQLFNMEWSISGRRFEFLIIKQPLICYENEYIYLYENENSVFFSKVFFLFYIFKNSRYTEMFPNLPVVFYVHNILFIFWMCSSFCVCVVTQQAFSCNLIFGIE